MKYIAEHRQLVGTSIIAVIGAAVLVGLFVYNQPRTPKVIFQPTRACTLLSPAKAMDTLGNQVNQIAKDTPVRNGSVATSQCAYTDGNPDSSQMVEISIAVQSALNDIGVAENKSSYNADKKKDASVSQDVRRLGESAYFNANTGLLRILDGKRIILLNYKVGDNTTSKPLADVVALAHSILK